MKKILKEFEEFALKGNMIDLAVGVIIGGAFNGIVSSLVNSIVMPILSIFTGKIDFSNLFIALNGQSYDSLKAAQEANASVIGYGAFLTELLNFLIMAFVVFLVVKELNKLHKKPEPPAKPSEQVCPYCKSKIAVDATRCPHCTSVLDSVVSDSNIS